MNKTILCLLALIICYLFLCAFNFLFIAIYTRAIVLVERRIKIRKNSSMTVNENKDDDSRLKSNIKNTVVRILATIIQNYMYGWVRYCTIKVGNIPSNRIRNILYRVVFNAKITKKTVINGGCEIRSPWNLKAGNCIIMNNCILDARSGIVIEDDVVFGTGVHIWTEQHDVDSPTFAVLEKNRGCVHIKQHAWICSDSTILPRITVGEGAVLASRAVATKDLESFGVYSGIPAIKRRERNRNLVYTLSGKPHWHFY